MQHIRILIFSSYLCILRAVNPTTKVEALQGILDLYRMKRLLWTLREKEVKKPHFNTLKSKDDKRYFFGALTPCEGGARVQSWRENIIETVESILSPLHEAVLVKMPEHTVMSVSVLVSLPGAVEQQLHIFSISEASRKGKVVRNESG